MLTINYRVSRRCIRDDLMTTVRSSFNALPLNTLTFVIAIASDIPTIPSFFPVNGTDAYHVSYRDAASFSMNV